MAITLVRVWRAGITLSVVLAFIVVMGLKLAEQYLLRPLLNGLASALSHVWVIGGRLSHAVLNIEHNIAHWLAEGALATEGPVINLLNGLAAIVAVFVLAFYWLALEAYKGFRMLWHVSVPAFTHAVVRPVLRLARGVASVEHWLVRELHHDYGLLRRYIHAVELEATRALRAAVHAFHRAVAVSIDRPLHWTERELRTAEGRISRLWRYVRSINGALLGLLSGAFVLSQLARFGLGWLRCRNVKRVGRALCGFPVQALEDLLGGALEILVFADLCELTRLVAAAATAIRPVLVDLVAIEGAALCNGQHQAPPALPLYGATLPVATSPLPL